MSAYKNAAERSKIADFIIETGCYDGEHHKQWVLDQTLRKLLGDDYESFIKDFLFNHEAFWDKGIAP